MERIIIYQVLPRLFGNTNTTRKQNGTLQENGVGKFSSFSGKALKAIRLLGCTHVWYTGAIEHATQTDYSQFGIYKDNPTVVKGKAGSPYAIKDYYDVDPDLADNVDKRVMEFENLIKRTHQNDMKVIIDFVPNHLARSYVSDMKPAGVIDFGQDDNTTEAFAPNNNFYYLIGQKFTAPVSPQSGEEAYNENPAKATGNDCFTSSPSIVDWYETVKLNYGVDYFNNRASQFDPIPDTWHKTFEILRYWAEKGVDGFRCDMAEMVPYQFWGWVIPKIKELFPQVIFIAEIYTPSSYQSYMNEGKFDYLYDKVGLYDTLKPILRGEQSASAITKCWQNLDGYNHRMLNFLENHDEQRLASPFFAGDPFKAIPALILSATISSSPYMIYFGQELGEPGMDNEGFSGEDGRSTIFDYWSIDTVCRWNNKGKFDEKLLTDKEKELKALYAHLLNLCNSEAALREGDMYDLMYANYDNEAFNGHILFSHLRREGKELILSVINFSGETANCSLQLPSHAFEYLNIPHSSELKFKELLTGKTVKYPFTPDQRIELGIPAYGGILLKTKI